jgi:hypothetical protein
MPPYSLRRLLWGGPVSTVAAILANLLYYGVTNALGEHYLMPLESNSQLIRMPVILPVLLTMTAGLLASLFFAVLVRFSRGPGIIFLSVCLTALLLSFGGPFNLPAAAIQTKILLSGMHVLAAVIITGGILFISHQ